MNTTRRYVYRFIVLNSVFSYQSIITKGFTRIDRILKVAMTPHENSEMFIGEYLKLVEEREQSEFQKIIEMKVRSGIKYSGTCLI